MSKTYRYDPEAGMHPNYRRKHPYADQFVETDEEDAPRGAAGGPETPGIDPEWAIRRMSRCVKVNVDRLVKSGAIRESDREESEQLVNIRIWRLCPTYSSDRTGKAGRKSTPEHFLAKVVESTAKNIRRDAMLRNSVFTLLPAAGASCEGDGGGEAAPGEMFNVSAGRGREMENLIARMDLEALLARLTEEERVCLAMRLDRASDAEVADEINLMRDREAARSGREARHIDRMYVIRKLRRGIEGKARLLGFAPERMKTA